MLTLTTHRRPIQSAQAVTLVLIARLRSLSGQAITLILFALIIMGLSIFYRFGEEVYLDWITPDHIPGIDVFDSLNGIPHPILHSSDNGTTYLPRVFLFLPVDRLGAAHSQRGRRFCRVLQSAIVSGWSPIVFNWNVKERHTWAKPFGLAEILHSPNHTSGVKEEDLIFMIDSWDVWLQLSPTTMARRFLEYDNGQLVAGAEKACWPNPPETCNQAPRSPLSDDLFRDTDHPHDLTFEEFAPRYANSGTVIGRLDAMRGLYDEITAYMETEEYKFKNDDQGAFNDFLAEGKIQLDYYSRLFWPLFGDWANLEFINTRHPPDSSASPDGEDVVPWELYPPLAQHRLLGEIPVAIHFNSRPKDIMDNNWGKSWWNSQRHRFRPLIKSQMQRGKIRFVTDTGYREESIGALCPKLEVWKAA